MKRIVAPTRSAEDWQRLLARPGLHWKPGHSAMALALSWESADPAVPGEVAGILESSGDPLLNRLDLLLAIPEYQVDLPGGQHPSQTDLFALLRGESGVVALAVEGKVNETFGPTVGQKRADASIGARERLAWLTHRLGLSSVPDEIRYQLLHRSASALLLAEQFHAAAAVMLVHSFSPTGKWLEDFKAFTGLFGARADVGQLVRITEGAEIPLLVGWCTGDPRFLEEDARAHSRNEHFTWHVGDVTITPPPRDKPEQ